MKSDREYLEVLLSPVRTVSNYQPQLGKGIKKGISASDFQKIYSSDSFYRWLGLDMLEVYTAHRVAGGLTSLYRQIGIGCERLVRTVIQDCFELSSEDTRWSYTITEGSAKRSITLDARIETEKVKDDGSRARFQQWLSVAANKLEVSAFLKGTVIEVRQGYKSKDSKRQNADIQSAARAYQSSYLPCMLILSQQIDNDLERRYRNAGWLVLKGVPEDDPCRSTYAFMRGIVGYDLQGLFERNQQTLREQVRAALLALLQVEDETDGGETHSSR